MRVRRVLAQTPLLLVGWCALLLTGIMLDEFGVLKDVIAIHPTTLWGGCAAALLSLLLVGTAVVRDPPMAALCALVIPLSVLAWNVATFKERRGLFLLRAKQYGRLDDDATYRVNGGPYLHLYPHLAHRILVLPHERFQSPYWTTRAGARTVRIGTPAAIPPRSGQSHRRIDLGAFPVWIPDAGLPDDGAQIMATEFQDGLLLQIGPATPP